MVASTETEAWLALLIEYGYRPNQLVIEDGYVRCRTDDLPAVVALVQNPHSFNLASPAMSKKIRQRVLLGYLPHHLTVLFDGTVALNREAVDIDVEHIAYRE